MGLLLLEVLCLVRVAQCVLLVCVYEKIQHLMLIKHSLDSPGRIILSLYSLPQGLSLVKSTEMKQLLGLYAAVQKIEAKLIL